MEPVPLQRAQRQLPTLIRAAFFHRDPFDRLLAAQALTEGLPLVSRDAAFDAYRVNRIW